MTASSTKSKVAVGGAAAAAGAGATAAATKALLDAELYAVTPKKFVARIERYWTEWR
jgi:hypothetical protein